MPKGDIIIFLIIGGVFVVVGIIMYLVGRREESRYYDSLYTRTDIKEFLRRFPKHPEPLALKIGGRISVAVGVVMSILGGIFWRLG